MTVNPCKYWIKNFFKVGFFSSCGYEIGRAADPGRDIKRKLKKDI